MDELVWMTVEEINLDIAKNIKNIRKRRGLSQEKLANKSNVSLGSIKRFETKGEISLYSLTKIAVALDLTSSLLNLFKDIDYQSIEEVKNEKRS